MTRIYHITHIQNLQSIGSMGKLWCDAQRIRQGFPSTNIGYTHIKQRRLSRPVLVPPGGVLGDYVPFNFCNRSVMLYTISQGNVAVVGGQTLIAHLVSTDTAVASFGRPFTFTDRHAELGYAIFGTQLATLPTIVQLPVMGLQYWSHVREERQAEFLVHDWFPWTLIDEIGVYDATAQSLAQQAISGLSHQPPVVVRRSWYY